MDQCGPTDDSSALSALIIDQFRQDLKNSSEKYWCPTPVISSLLFELC